MASLQASSLVLSSSSNKIRAAVPVPKLPRVPMSVPKMPTRTVVEELNMRAGFTKTVPIDVESYNSTSIANTQLYALLEAVADRVEMHNNIGKQRDNWNTLLLNSINMITLTAATFNWCWSNWRHWNASIGFEIIVRAIVLCSHRIVAYNEQNSALTTCWGTT